MYDKFFQGIIVIILLSNFAYPIYLDIKNPDMSVVTGNPKPIYMYDIDESCDFEKIESTLDSFSEETGVKFIQLSHPYALVLGGISFECVDNLADDAVGEAETGLVGGGIFIFAWNNIRLLDIDRGTILHEVLHVMSFDHRDDQNSIMYPYSTSETVDKEIVQIIKKYYSENPLAYINLLTMNIYTLILILFLFFLLPIIFIFGSSFH